MVHFTLGGVALLRGDLEEACRAFREAIRLGLDGDNMAAATAAMWSLAGVHVARGQLPAAIRLYREAGELGRARGAGHLTGQSRAETELAEVLLERNDLAEAERRATTGLGDAQQGSCLPHPAVAERRRPGGR